MPFIKKLCPICSKVIEVTKEFTIGDKTVYSTKCGHVIAQAQLECSSPEQLVSLDGKTLYPFQCEGVRFLEKSGARALVSDEMGLGKTIQALGTLALHEKELLPFLAVVKSSLKTQWQHETMRWLGEDKFAQIIEGTKDCWLPGMCGYIISYDLLRRFATKDPTTKKHSVINLPINNLGIKTVILDEVQQIKNTESQRTVFTRELCKGIEHVIALSGTPIKNNAAEYFPILNILKPEMFSQYHRFVMNECDSYSNGFGYKVGGLRNPKAFLDKTKSFIIRRTRAEVLPDLPSIQRTYSFHELSKAVEERYKETFKQFRDEYNSIESYEDDSMGFDESSNILAYLSKMRHLTGLSKIDPCVDFVQELMEETEDRIAIFVHHKDVAEILIMKLNKMLEDMSLPPCARHEAGSSSIETEEAFAKTRVAVLSTLAGGEGLNLQKLCYRFIMLERQWNPSNEEQAEARFPRPEGLKVSSILGTYFIATGTVDEFFTEIVERKREIVGKTLDGVAVEWNQSSLMKELAETLAQNGGRKWSI